MFGEITFFEFDVVSGSPRRYPEAFLDPVAPSSPNISPWRAMATLFMPKSVYLYTFWVLNLLLLSMFFLKNEFLVGDRHPLTRVGQMRNDILHLPDPS